MDKMPSYLQEHRATLHETSSDKTQKEYMCNSTLTVFDFDGLKDWYVENHLPKLTQTPCSNDALWLDDNHVVFIEWEDRTSRK